MLKSEKETEYPSQVTWEDMIILKSFCYLSVFELSLTPSIPKVNLSKPRKLLNPKLSNET